MAIKFQYNKTSLQQLEKQLKVRVRTLPCMLFPFLPSDFPEILLLTARP